MRSSLVVAAAIVTASLPDRADACGGFFCATVPIDQSGEQIIFTLKGEDVEAHVQISYQGDAKSFSWVVPVEAQPTLSIGSPQFFNALAFATQPRFRLEWTESPSCRSFGARSAFNAGPPEMAAEGGGGDDKGVKVLSEEQVGPYDAAILQASSADALVRWLDDSGYVLTPQGRDALTPYVAPEYYFVALKLKQDKGVGDLRPIVLKMKTGRACIPIRLTAVAARPNMPITAYVFAEHRAVPQNYRHVLINQTRIDWLRGGMNYNSVATDAVDEAGGHAFLTEFARPTETIRNQLWQLRQGDGWDTAKLATITDPAAFVQEMLRQNFPRDSTIQSLLRKYIPMPKALVGQVTEQQFYNNLSAYKSYIDNDPGRAPFDAKGFAAELEQTIVAPLRRANEIVARFPYLTRLYTTMSAEEMTVDPEFQFNPDVPEVSNVYRAKATPVCNVYDPNDMKVRIELEDGRYFFTSFQTGAIDEGPAAERVETIGTSGPPIVLKDNSGAIAEVLKARGGGGVRSSGCAAASGAPMLAALLGLMRLVRKR